LSSFPCFLCPPDLALGCYSLSVHCQLIINGPPPNKHDKVGSFDEKTSKLQVCPVQVLAPPKRWHYHPAGWQTWQLSTVNGRLFTLGKAKQSTALVCLFSCRAKPLSPLVQVVEKLSLHGKRSCDSLRMLEYILSTNRASSSSSFPSTIFSTPSLS
jgi:hypothetical protein